MRNAIATTIERFQHLDSLVLNAGDAYQARIDDPSTTTEIWREVFDVNFFSLLYTVQEALPALRESELKGRIIFVSSGSALLGTPALGVYNASKAAMNAFCRYVQNRARGAPALTNFEKNNC